MHYYQFNIGDYAAETRHLSHLENLAYRLGLEWLYYNEKPLPLCVDEVARLLNMRDCIGEIEQVLAEFFIKTDAGWAHKRVDLELVKYHAKADAARANGKLGGRPKNPVGLQKKPKANPEITQSKANQEPITINHKPITKEKEKVPKRKTATRFDSPPLDDVILYFREKQKPADMAEGFWNYYESNGWRVGKNAMKNWKAAASGWIKRQAEYDAQRKQVTGSNHIDIDNIDFTEGLSERHLDKLYGTPQ